MKTCSRELRTSDWGEGFPSNRTMTLSTQPRQRRNGFGTSLWLSQSPDLNQIEHLWRDLKIAVNRRSPSHLTELESICRIEWEKLPKYRCAELVVSYPRRLEALIAAKGASTKYWLKSLNTYVNFLFHFNIFNKFSKNSENLFLLCRYGVLCEDWLGGKKTM